MANTKIPIELSSTPSIVDNGDATAITIDSSERVGINTSSPAKKLHITDTSGNHIRVAYSDGYYWDVGRQSADGRLSFTDVTGGEILALRTGGGITFNGDTAAANALDDYEEGTWTPVHGGNNMTGTATYTKIGRYVYIAGDVTSATGSSTSSQITGLPFTVLNSHHHGSFVVGWTNTGVQGGYVINAGTGIEAVNAGTNTADTIDAGGRIIFAASYITA